MAYSAKKRWTFSGGAVALALGSILLLGLLKHNHVDPVLTTSLFMVISLIAYGGAVWAYSYLDEVQRQTGYRLWFWGSMIGVGLSLPVAMLLLVPNTPWLDATVQFIFHHPGTLPPRLYFSFGLVVPLAFQTVVCLVLKLLEKLSRGSQS